MSERPPPQLLLATLQLSADGKRVLPDENEVRLKPVSEATALATLQAFAGLSANTLFYNATLGVDMFFGRFFMLIPILGIAGSLAAKKRVPESVGTLL